MASIIFVPNPAYNNANPLGDSKLPLSHSFGHLSLPKKSAVFQPNCTSHPSFLLSSPPPPPPSNSDSVNRSKSSTTVHSLPHLWREIQGCNNWENLANPLHPLLRQEIIRYGKFVTACYKAFDFDSNSKRFLCCKYGKKNMLTQVGMHDSGYQITKYIYASPDVTIPIQNTTSCGRWIGYVAVSTDETVTKIGRRDILITFRGTVTPHEWVANFMSSLTPAKFNPCDPRLEVQVESGFLSIYTSNENAKFGLISCREQLISEVSRLLKVYKGEQMSISIAGHSMGSSLAHLLAYDICELGFNKINGSANVIPVTVFSFGGPRVGNLGFKDRCDELGVKILRIVNVNDPITKLPGVFLNENFRVWGDKYELPWSDSCYSHVGVEIVLDFFDMQNLSHVHDLEAYITSLLKKCSDLPSIESFEGNIKVYNLLERQNYY